mmetsp:Transcript_13450/g.38769  ORF Transcript_13450/g.38769 Transcript_13450/m.38769 type:complete len:206 (+) Transcript_13450:678-1295(+)
MRGPLRTSRSAPTPRGAETAWTPTRWRRSHSRSPATAPSHHPAPTAARCFPSGRRRNSTECARWCSSCMGSSGPQNPACPPMASIPAAWGTRWGCRTTPGRSMTNHPGRRAPTCAGRPSSPRSSRAWSCSSMPCGLQGTPRRFSGATCGRGRSGGSCRKCDTLPSVSRNASARRYPRPSPCPATGRGSPHLCRRPTSTRRRPAPR